VSVSAPAGYGKTTFLAQAAARERRAVAWVSLDAHDDDAASLASLLAVALDLIRPIDPKVLKAIAAPAISPWSAVTRLGSALEHHPALVLFIDDADSLAPGPAADVLTALPDLLPPGSRLVLAGRASPPIALSRRRVAGTVLELDPTDLALDDQEAFALAEVLRDGIDEATAAMLNRQAEGWVAGLYLGIMATADLRDLTTHGLTGDSRAIARYLRSEILGPLGPDLVAFLRRTSFLERMSGPLCDAVLGRTDSATILTALESANRFIVPMDDRGVWYRQHNLLRDLLRADLEGDDSDDIARLATNASTWFDEHDSPGEAIDYARLAGDETRLARLLVTHTQTAFNAGNGATVQRWFDEVEAAPWMVRHPELAVTGAIYFALVGDPARAGQWMHMATATAAAGPMPDGSGSIHAWLALSRAIMAQNGAASMLADAAIAVDQIPSLSPWRTAALAALGIAHYLAGDDLTAEATLAEADRASIPPAAASCRALALAYRAILAIEHGEWARAGALTTMARDIVLRNSLSELPLMGIVFALTARVATRRGNRIQAASDQAHAHRLRAGLSVAVPWLTVGTNLELARLALAQSDAAGTRTLLRESTDILSRFPSFGRLAGDVVTLRERAAAAASVVIGASALTAAELRLWPYLSTYLSFREIGERVGVSANTIKSQTMSIYRKLDVSSRGDAIARAAAIGLTDPLRDPGFRADDRDESLDTLGQPTEPMPYEDHAVVPPGTIAERH
jgi:LuxR family maltose regulon positive regulatory protein